VASLSELAAKIDADRAAAEDLGGVLSASREQAEQTATAIGGLGIEGASRRMRAAADRIEEAESIRAALQGALVKAHFQVMSAVHGKIGPGAPGSGAIVPLKRVDEQTGAPKAGLDAIPPHLRQDSTPDGVELTGVDPSLSSFQKEHENANSDRKMNRLSRAARIGVRNAEDLKSGAQQLVTGANADIDSFGPPPGGYNTITQVPDPYPQIHSIPTQQPSATDLVGTAAILATVIAEGAGRLIERRKRRLHGK
jgi:hypothetical protein